MKANDRLNSVAERLETS